MTIEEFKNKYEQMKDSNIYKSYCSVLENKDLILRKTLKEKQELIEYLKEQINECKLSGNDEDYVRADVYEEILNKIELYKREPNEESI